MTITLQAVNELIQSLESAGELSIKETKVMALAKAYQQLAAENVALSKDAQRYRFIRERDMFGSDNESGLLSWEELTELECNEFDDALDARINHPNTGFIELDAKLQARETPATDRIVAGFKADGVEEFVRRLQQCVDEGDFVGDEVAVIVGAIDCGKEFFEQLREGADK
ncbi:TPA: hypothetical protein ACMX9M_003616 [Klebsiella variicola]|nr:hypothetical protein [Klebsiella variicola]ELA1952234.1 hypothetical protein [Klebsiella variicola]HCB9329653.1 hypothetical protein [Klebsiella variicola]HDK6722532.1 hypothetical protein [Klebsiella variicola]HDZ9768741.1 hypothetical protein [Klebsiella variicola subsp. variicola]